MVRKKFFKTRSVAQIRKLKVSRVRSRRNLVRRVLDMDPSADAIELTKPLTPEKYFRKGGNWKEASIRHLRHGKLIPLRQPGTVKAAHECSDIPLAVRSADFSRVLWGQVKRDMTEENIDFLGYSWRPVRKSGDARRRIVYFGASSAAIDIFRYGERLEEKGGGGIGLKPYTKARAVIKGGATVDCSVFSREVGANRYRLRLVGVPFEGVTEKRSAIWGFKVEYLSAPPAFGYYATLKYKLEGSQIIGDDIAFDPHPIAAYLKFAGESWKRHNMTPMEMNPFTLLSKEGFEFWKKLESNLVVRDRTLSSKLKLRPLHLDEKCMMMAMLIGVVGPDESVFWDPGRDGKIKDYSWVLDPS